MILFQKNWYSTGVNGTATIGESSSGFYCSDGLCGDSSLNIWVTDDGTDQPYKYAAFKVFVFAPPTSAPTGHPTGKPTNKPKTGTPTKTPITSAPATGTPTKSGGLINAYTKIIPVASSLISIFILTVAW